MKFIFKDFLFRNYPVKYSEWRVKAYMTGWSTHFEHFICCIYYFGLSLSHALRLKGLSAFWQICTFLIFFLDGKLFATSEFSDKNMFEQKFPLLSLLRIIWFSSDRLFLLYKSSFEKTLKKRAFSIEGV
jgi:hypothetical protein